MSTAHAGLLVPGDHKHRCPKCHESKFCPHACSPCEDQSEGQAVPHGYYAECEDCARPRTTTRSIPYAGASSPIPRTTAFERIDIEHAAAIAALELVSYEPHHAMCDRAWWRNWRDHEETVEFVRDFNARWRSLPEFRGGTNPPSGIVLEAQDPVSRRRVKTDGRCVFILCVPTHGTDERVPEKDELRAPGSKRIVSTLREWLVLFLGAEPKQWPTLVLTGSLYDRPEQSGRGWCPKLAGVDR